MIDHNAILLDVLSRHGDATKWCGSNFEHIKRVSNTKVGEVGQDFIEDLCGKLGYECVFPTNKKGQRAKQNPWDIQVNNVQLELKTATEDVNGSFQFNHIRYHRPYHGVLCLGVSPNDIYFGIWSKAQISTGKAGSLVSMEKGANASYKLTKKPDSLYPITKFDNILRQFISNYLNESNNQLI